MKSIESLHPEAQGEEEVSVGEKKFHPKTLRVERKEFPCSTAAA